ncbi:hypothetical protein IZ6_20300 [Terrihabitans soli]|uniref:Uncharacterized protein n=1 Tax=Terrihabitans soli TaxID=708113 RepID=A0A6S6QUQ4_9HYPH|nr:hypothetical protein IZ6_20300 [Terrihabitans soli]
MQDRGMQETGELRLALGRLFRFRAEAIPDRVDCLEHGRAARLGRMRHYRFPERERTIAQGAEQVLNPYLGIWGGRW